MRMWGSWAGGARKRTFFNPLFSILLKHISTIIFIWKCVSPVSMTSVYVMISLRSRSSLNCQFHEPSYFLQIPSGDEDYEEPSKYIEALARCPSFSHLTKLSHPISSSFRCLLYSGEKYLNSEYTSKIRCTFGTSSDAPSERVSPSLSLLSWGEGILELFTSKLR